MRRVAGDTGGPIFLRVGSSERARVPDVWLLEPYRDEMMVALLVGTIGLLGVLLGARLSARADVRRFRYDATRDAMVEVIHLAAKLQVAVRQIAQAAGGPGHELAVRGMDDLLVELNFHLRAVELVSSWRLSGKSWRNLGEIEKRLDELREPALVIEWIRRPDKQAWRGLPEIDIFVQGIVNVARRELGYKLEADFD